MAGNAKPSIPNLGEEIVLSNISGTGYTGSLNGLFDGIVANEWNTERVCYWNTTSGSITFTTSHGVNIWRCGTSEWASRNAIFSDVEKLNEETGQFEKCDNVVQNALNLTLNQWGVSMVIPVSGTYKFYGLTSNYRIDSEWYVEKISLKTTLNFYKTLSSDVPMQIEAGLQEVHFTEKGEIFTYTNEGKKLQLGGSRLNEMIISSREW